MHFSRGVEEGGVNILIRSVSLNKYINIYGMEENIFKLNQQGDYLLPMLRVVGITVRLSQLPLVIGTSSIAISPVYDNPAIPSKITYK